jgi:hypothetical protein
MAGAAENRPVRWTAHALVSLEDRAISRAAADATISQPKRVESRGGGRRCACVGSKTPH